MRILLQQRTSVRCIHAVSFFLALLMLTSASASQTSGGAQTSDGAQISGGARSPLRIASWNLGWHVSTAELPAWIKACDQRYLRNAVSGEWERSQAPDAVIGWQVKESRAKLQGVDLAVMPPCSVYLDARRRGVAVTPAAWAKRLDQTRRILLDQVAADIIAFQEVSGAAAVREVLGASADQYHVCSFEGRYRVQRLAFAWRKTLGPASEPCQVVHDLSLPELAPDEQVRPGLVMALTVRGRTLRLLNLHLKSSCVSPLERGRLDGEEAGSPCRVLQAQVAPLEAAFEKLGAGGASFVVLGDFNRNLWHEARQVSGADALRTDGGRDLKSVRAKGVRTRNLWLEINDGDPPESRAALLPLVCAGPADSARICDQAKEGLLERAVLRELGSARLMGCRNPVGLDQVVVSVALAERVREAIKLPIGRFGGTLAARPPEHPDPVLSVSDHCPMRVTLDW